MKHFTHRLPTTLAAFLALCVLPSCTSPNAEFCTELTDCGVLLECNLESRVCEDIVKQGQFSQLLVNTSEVDVLFVVDNSGSMSEEQGQLAADVRFLFEGFSTGVGHSMHVGVISGDMGAGDYGIMGCDGNGDGGQLLSAPTAECEGPTDAFLAFIEDEVGVSTQNFIGTPEEAFACIARLGTTGCGFEQPLAAVEEALRPFRTENLGFVRPDALLVVIHVTDEDDCSAVDDRLFDSDPSLDSIDSELGPLSSYRCFDFGVTCNETDPDPEIDRQIVGARTGCRSNDASNLMLGASQHVQFLRDVKEGRPLVWSVNIAGATNDGTAETSFVNDEPSVVSSCASDKGDATPAFRLESVTNEFGLPAPVTSICDSTYRRGLGDIALVVTAMATGECVAAEPKDWGEEPGLQSDCHIFDVADGGRGEVLASMAQCRGGIPRPCFTMEVTPLVCTTGSGRLVEIKRREVPIPPGSAPVLRCTAK